MTRNVIKSHQPPAVQSHLLPSLSLLDEWVTLDLLPTSTFSSFFVIHCHTHVPSLTPSLPPHPPSAFTSHPPSRPTYYRHLHPNPLLTHLLPSPIPPPSTSILRYCLRVFNPCVPHHPPTTFTPSPHRPPTYCLRPLTHLLSSQLPLPPTYLYRLHPPSPSFLTHLLPTNLPFRLVLMAAIYLDWSFFLIQ